MQSWRGHPQSTFWLCSASSASRDKLPPPTDMRKIKQQSMAKSVRASLTMYQKPWLARNNSGTFVVAIAVVITMSSGIDTSLVHSPIKSRRPHRISKVPTKWAVKYGCGNPILVKRVTPILESIYFRMPCVKKIRPIARRTRRRLRGAAVRPKRKQMILLIAIELVAVLDIILSNIFVDLRHTGK